MRAEYPDFLIFRRRGPATGACAISTDTLTPPESPPTHPITLLRAVCAHNGPKSIVSCPIHILSTNSLHGDWLYTRNQHLRTRIMGLCDLAVADGVGDWWWDLYVCARVDLSTCPCSERGGPRITTPYLPSKCGIIGALLSANP